MVLLYFFLEQASERFEVVSLALECVDLLLHLILRLLLILDSNLIHNLFSSILLVEHAPLHLYLQFLHHLLLQLFLLLGAQRLISFLHRLLCSQ